MNQTETKFSVKEKVLEAVKEVKSLEDPTMPTERFGRHLIYTAIDMQMELNQVDLLWLKSLGLDDQVRYKILLRLVERGGAYLHLMSEAMEVRLPAGIQTQIGFLTD